MNEFWTTLLNSPVANSAFTCIFVLLLQHLYSKRLANHKKEIQQLLDEHQIRFEYWHKEKFRAMKKLYTDASNIYYMVNSLHNADNEYSLQHDKELREKERNDLLNKLDSFIEKPLRDWNKNRLFLDKKIDKAFVEFNIKADLWLLNLVDSDVEKRKKFIQENGKIIQKETKEIMANLRESFRMSLLDSETKKESSSSSFFQKARKIFKRGNEVK